MKPPTAIANGPDGDPRLATALGGLARLAARVGAAPNATVLLVSEDELSEVARHGPGTPVQATLRRWALGEAGPCLTTLPDGRAYAVARITSASREVLGLLEVVAAGPSLADDVGAALTDLAEQIAILLAQHQRLSRLLEMAWQRSRAASRLIEHEEQFRLALDALSAHIAVLDSDGGILAVNQAWRDYGHSRGSTGDHGGNYLAVCDRAAAQGVTEAAGAAAGIRAVAGGLEPRFELDYACSGPGDERWFSLRVTRFPRRDRQWVVTAHTDITDQRRAAAALRESRERFAGIISSALDAIISIDVADQVTVYNAAAERMFGWPAAEIIGGPFARLLPESIRARQCAWLALTRTMSPLPDSPVGADLLRGLRRSGEEFPSETSVSRLETRDGPLITLIVRDVTERERAQQALQRSQERWALAVEGSNDGIWDWSAEEGAYFSQRCHEMLGYDAEDFPQDLGHWLGLLHPDDRERVCEALVLNVIGASLLLAVEYRARCRDGTWKWLLTRGRARMAIDRGPRLAGSTTDISERKLNEFALRESQARNAAIIDSSLDAILSMDDQGRITRFNPAAERILGRSEVDVLGHDLGEIIVPPEHGAGSGPLLTTRESGNLGRRLDLEAVRADGSRLPVEVAVVAVPVQGSLLFIAHLRDLSEKRAAEARLRRHEQQLIQSEKMVALGTLVSGVAHEINNPANFIALNTPLLLRLWNGVLPTLDAYAVDHPGFAVGTMTWSEVRALVPQCHDGIQEGVRRIKRIVTDLKDFAREDTPGFADDVDLNAVVATAVRLAEHTVRKWTHTLRLELGAGLPALSGSHQRLEQVVINLLINACQALPRHDCAIHVRTRHDEAAMTLVLEVEDEGIGIPIDLLPRIIEPFFTTKRDIGGTGLGLSVSTAIIAEHGGTMTFSSTVGRGTTVRVVLPVERQPG